MSPCTMFFRLVCCSLLTLAAAFPAGARQVPGEIIVRVTDDAKGGGSPREEGAYINGYSASLDGQTILYHSAHPDAEAALIVRANSEAHSASWETDTIPAHVPEKPVRIIWLAGLERAGWGESKNGHPFGFFINGVRRFTFRNYKDTTATRWSLRDSAGAELAFSARMADKFGDQFGYMTLTIPGGDVPAGKPLTLQVVGEEANSPEWYMAFQYHFNFTPSVRAEPALFRETEGETQVLRLSLDNLREGRTIEIRTSEGTERRAPLRIGANIYTLPIPAVKTASTRSLVFRVNGVDVRRDPVEVAPVIPRTIYLLSHSHNDIGYTDLQPEVERKQWRNIDEALRLIEQTRNYPPDARFHWNIEVLWPLESYLRAATPEKRDVLLAAIRGGSIGVNALYGNELTGLATATEMSHFTDYARTFSREYAIPITTALVSDIPGFTWGIVPALAQSGVKYFASGPNSGDRIGYVLQQWGDKPFYWSSQSGEEKVLFWVAGAGYSTFHEGTLAKLGDEKLMKMMRRLDQSGYPYDMVHLPYTQGDNGPPDSTVSDFVRRWNETYASPRLILATHAQMFSAFEARYGASLPVIKGDFTPYWEDGALSTAYETALSRHAVDRLVAGEALWSMRSPKEYPQSAYDDAWRNVVLYDEHTWGASNSVSDPDAEGVRGQWRIKQRFALDADSLSRTLLAMALPQVRPEQGVTRAVDVYNPSAWERSEVVTMPSSMARAGDRVTDHDGVAVPSQRLSTGELAFFVRRLGPLSAERFTLQPGSAPADGAGAGMAAVLETSAIRLSVDARTGTISEFRWKSREVDLAAGGGGLNRYLYVPGTNPDSAVSLSNVTIRSLDRGPLVRSLLVEGTAPGCRKYSSELRLVEGSDRVEITTIMDKKAVRDKEAVHIGFPFAVPEGMVRYDVANAIVRPELDQLAGACKNFFSVQSWVDVSNATYGVTLATPDAPLVEIGSITAEKPWKTTVETSSTVYSYVLNNYWHTNYKADQEGVVTVRYALVPHGRFRPEEAAKFGAELRERLIVVPADTARVTEPLFRVAPASIVVRSVKPLAGGWLLYATNPSGRDESLQIHWNPRQGVRRMQSDAGGAAGKALGGPLRLKAHGSAYIRVDRRGGN